MDKWWAVEVVWQSDGQVGGGLVNTRRPGGRAFRWISVGAVDKWLGCQVNKWWGSNVD